jgi:hypothetical protein
MPDVARSPNVPEELRDLARAVRRIGDGYRCDPETVALAKDEIATRLAGLARQMEHAP